LRTKSTRRALCTALIGLTAKAERKVAGGFVFESQNAGHAIRDRSVRAAGSPPGNSPIVIVGGGIAGLSAAWWLDRSGFHDFVILELEETAGGNSRWGENEVSAYPWAAHYVPVPGPESNYVRELFTEFGLLKDGQWEERWLCHSPQERLFLHGRWQEGVEPEVGLSSEDHRQFKALESRIAEFRASGEFRIPMALGSVRQTASLDKTDFRSWLRNNGFTSPYLHWLADYSTRDDFGSSSADTSAWAGIHYFAARTREEKGPLTWPEGNGWIVRRLMNKLGKYVRTRQPVIGLQRSGTHWLLSTPTANWRAAAVIYAAPAFLLSYLDSTLPPVKSMQWSPWLTANLTLDRLPREKGMEPAWDNVIYNSPSLGYVVATHQSVRTHIEKTVWTYYWALTHKPAAEARRELLDTDWNTWCQRILGDLEKAHRDIRQCVSRIDIFRNAHAMVRPTPGFLSNPERKAWERGRERFYWASADVSGFSLFEEAQYRGIEAAKKALAAIGSVSKR
jgi:glycine/D-amino acid oxidase-like deaminating enzyme